MRALGAALIVLLVAGCSGPAPAPSTTLPPVTTATPRQAFALHDAGDLSNGADRHYNWTVQSGFTNLQVAFQIFGPNGLPNYGVTSLNFKLVDGNGKSVQEQHSGSGVTVGNNGCAMCYRGTATAAPGPWTFTFSAGPSAATYSMDVTVIY
ncbi:MAG: hypothetical protein ACYDBQ_04670 [Thermoplasmatota archaeon]